MQFTFPSEQIISVLNLNEAKRLVKLHLQQENLSAYCSYKFQLVRGLYIYCRCISCPARLTFKKKQQRFVLFKSITHHQHRKGFLRKQMVIEAIKNYPSCFNVAYIKQMIKKRFNISNATFYRYYRQSQSYGMNINDVLASIQMEGVFGVQIYEEMSGDTELPSILMLTSQLMIEKYYKNNKNVKFDLTYNLIKQRTFKGKQYAVGAFVSQNNNMNIEPLCLVIIAQETTSIFLMRSPPNIIITDEQNTIKLALQELRERRIFLGYHLHDMFHILRNAKKSLQNKQSINYLVNMSRSSHIIQYKRKRITCRNNLSQRDYRNIDRFQQKLTTSCIALIPPIFVGLSCSTNSCQKLNDIMKQKIPYSQKYLTVVSVLSKLLMNMLRKKKQFNIQKAKLQQFTIFQQIRQLRYKLCKGVFKRLMIQLSLSITCLINLGQQPNSYEVMQQNFEDGEKFLVYFDKQKPEWKCGCQITDKIGIPCCHILKVLFLTKQKVITAINYWWINNQTLPQERQSAQICFRRKTRRQFR